MLSYDRLKNNPRVLRALTSLNPEEFDTLLIPFEQAWQAEVSTHYRHKASRKRRYGGDVNLVWGPSKTNCSSFCFTSRCIHSQEVIAQVFGMSQGRANEWIHKLSPLLESALGEAHCLPERNPQNLAQVLALVCLGGLYDRWHRAAGASSTRSSRTAGSIQR